MDEYPFMPNSDMQPNFLKNYDLQKQSAQVLLRTVFFGGEGSPEGDSSTGDWRVLRYLYRRQRAERDGRTKPLYQPPQVNYKDGTHNLHEMLLLPNNNNNAARSTTEKFKYSPYDYIMGHDKMEDESILRLNHYWCERLVPGGDDGTYEELVYDDSMKDMIRKVEEWKVMHKQQNES